MLFTTHLAKRLTLTKLVCSGHLMHVWFLGVVSFSLLGLEDKAWPKNVHLDQSTVNSELWDHHSHAIKNVITFVDMQKDKTPRVIVILKNIFTQSAFFFWSPMSFLRGQFITWRQVGNTSSNRCGFVESTPHWVRSNAVLWVQASTKSYLSPARSLLPAVPECVFRHHDLCHSRSIPQGLVLCRDSLLEVRWEAGWDCVFVRKAG